MEILNNIWNALTTENEKLINFISFPLLFLEHFLSFMLFSKILNIQYSKKQAILYIIFASIFQIVLNVAIPEPYNVLVNYLVIYAILKYLFNFNFLKNIACIIIPFTIFGLVNSLLLNPFLKILNIKYEVCATTPLYRISYVFLVYVTILFIIFLLKYKNFTFTIVKKPNNKVLKVMMINFILSILTLTIQIFMTVYYFNTIPVVFTLFNFLLLFAYFFYNFYSLFKSAKLDLATQNLENAESYNNSLTVLYDNVRGFKHDFDNIVNIISGYLQVNDILGLKKYFSSFEKDCKTLSNLQMLNPSIINNPGIYNLIVSKYKKATDFDVIINFEFFFDFTNLKMPIYEFSRILGILLDNAIEAAKECEEKRLNLVFRESQKQHVQIISIENTYLNKEIDTIKIFEKGYSSKESHTGIGLWEVNKIIKKFNNISLKTSKDDKLFKQELHIYY